MTITTTNRELLRNYKKLKDKLVNGEVNEVIIPQKNGLEMRIRIEKHAAPMEKLLKIIKEKPLKLIVRPNEDIF